MADRAGWQDLFDWEQKICRETRPATLVQDLVREVTSVWQGISDPDKEHYVRTLRQVLGRLAKVRHQRRGKQRAQAEQSPTDATDVGSFTESRKKRESDLLGHRKALQSSLTSLAAIQQSIIRNDRNGNSQLLERSLAYTRQLLEENDKVLRKIRKVLGGFAKQGLGPRLENFAQSVNADAQEPSAAPRPAQARKAVQIALDAGEFPSKSQRGGAEHTGHERHFQERRKSQEGLLDSDVPSKALTQDHNGSLADYTSDQDYDAHQDAIGIEAAERQPKRFSELNDIELSALQQRLYALDAPSPLKRYYQKATDEGNESPFIQPALVLRRILRLLHEHGFGHDWDNEASIRTLLEQDTRQPEDPPAARFIKPKNLAAVAKSLGYGSPAGTWRFVDTVGHGGYGHAGLWAKEDQNGRLVQRAVVKESYVSEAMWDSPLFWSSLNPRVPREADVMDVLSGSRHSWPFVELLTWALYEKRAMYRLYMPHYVHSDLYQLIRNHKISAAFHHEPHPNIPVRALWAIFETLAAAVAVMGKGELPGEQLPDDWRTVVHRDFKPGNIFLDVPAESKWPGVPAAKLGDFGMAVSILTKTQQEREQRSGKNLDYKNPDDLCGWGSPGYKPPEQEYGHEALASYTNVWTVGKVMLNLMDLQISPEANVDHGLNPIPVAEGVRERYPSSMVHLVEQCLAVEPAERISADDLLRSIKEVVTSCGFDDVPLKFQPKPEDEILRYKADAHKHLFASVSPSGSSSSRSSSSDSSSSDSSSSDSLSTGTSSSESTSTSPLFVSE